jgi:cystathionine beta-lyase
MTPIYQTSTYVQAAPGEHKGYEYSRTQNPTRNTLESALAAAENAEHGVVFATGMAAVDAVLKLLKPGDEIIASNDLYGGTYRLMTKVFAGFGLKFHFVDMTQLANVQAVATEHTRLLWIETPTNPLLNVVDIAALCQWAQAKQVLTVVDNTFATPVLQQPLDMGADLVIHSLTKYFGGHSDVVMGALMTRHPELYTRLKFIQNASGAVPGPQDSFLVLRGMKTLHIRMERHCQNGRKVAEYLEQHPKVARVYYPGLTSHPQHAVAARQMRDFGGMVSFYTKADTLEESLVILKNTQLFALAESLGGVESLIGHPATMTHASIPAEERRAAGLHDSLIRLSVGIEDADDLIADLDQAFARI